MIDIWRQWIAAFDGAFETGSWSEAKEFLTDDVVYIVAGAPFACEIRGRDAVIAGFRKSLTNFDKKFDARRWEAVDLHVWGEHAVTCLAKGDYAVAGKPPITFAAKGTWFFRSGKISAMTDLYDLTETNIQETLHWLAAHGANMDASYT